MVERDGSSRSSSQLLFELSYYSRDQVTEDTQSTRTGSEAITGNTSGECDDVSKQPTIMIIATILLWVAAEYYATWFWWRGLGSLERGPCGDHAFFFARVNLHGWFRWLHRAINAFMVGGSSLVLLSCVLISLIIWLEMCKCE